MNEINAKLVTLLMLCILVIHGPRADSRDVAQLLSRLCSTKRRLDSVTCIGSVTKSKFPANLARCARDRFREEDHLSDFGVTALCNAVETSEASDVLKCALSYSNVRTFKIRALMQNCVLDAANERP